MTNLAKTKITNPLDELFNTLPTDLEKDDDYIPVTEGDIAKVDAQQEKDDEDREIDSKIDTVYAAAIDAFNTQTSYLEVIEPRYAARNAEVAANYLTIALNAATARAKVKGDRKRSAQFVPFSNNKLNGTVVASREDIMNMLALEAEIKK